MVEYGLLASAADFMSSSLSGALDMAMRAADDLIRIATEHPLITAAIVASLVALTRIRPRGGR